MSSTASTALSTALDGVVAELYARRSVAIQVPALREEFLHPPGLAALDTTLLRQAALVRARFVLASPLPSPSAPRRAVSSESAEPITTPIDFVQGRQVGSLGFANAEARRLVLA